jgi:mRNA interferase MazF
MTYIPSRGDIMWLVLDPQVGFEQAGRRPVLVLSEKEFNTLTHLALICPITSKIKGHKLEVPLPPILKTKGAALPFHIKSLDISGRKAEYIENAPDYVTNQAAAIVQSFIGL